MVRRKQRPKNDLLNLLQLLAAVSFVYPLFTLVFFVVYIFSPKTSQFMGGQVPNMGHNLGKWFMDAYFSPLALVVTVALGTGFIYLMLLVQRNLK